MNEEMNRINMTIQLIDFWEKLVEKKIIDRSIDSEEHIEGYLNQFMDFEESS